MAGFDKPDIGFLCAFISYAASPQMGFYDERLTESLPATHDAVL